MKHLLIMFIIGIFIFAAVSAGDLKNERKEIKEDKRQLAFSIKAYHQLSKAVDYWHDANLRGDNREVKKYEQEFLSIMEDDIKVTALQILDARDDVKVARKEAKGPQQNKLSQIDDRRDLQNEKVDLSLRKKSFRTKKQLLSSIKKSSSFSYRYRLLNDFIDILRKEVEAEKVEMAENIGEWYEERLEKR